METVKFECYEIEIVLREIFYYFEFYQIFSRFSIENNIIYILEYIIRRGEFFMAKWACVVCGYVYDEAEGDVDNNIEPGTLFEELPEDFVCPLCGVGKDEFEEVKE